MVGSFPQRWEYVITRRVKGQVWTVGNDIYGQELGAEGGK